MIDSRELVAVCDMFLIFLCKGIEAKATIDNTFQTGLFPIFVEAAKSKSA